MRFSAPRGHTAGAGKNEKRLALDVRVFIRLAAGWKNGKPESKRLQLRMQRR